MQPIATPTCWSEIKDTVKKLNPAFYEALDSVSPGDDLRLLIVKYPYGYIMSDENAFYLPKEYENYMDGNGFDKDAPLVFVLDKQVQLYFDTAHTHVPWPVYAPGSFFPATLPIELIGMRIYPKSIMRVSSGMRDVTLLSLHGNTNDFYQLRRKYQLPVHLSPENPLNHFEIFKHIVNEENINWSSTVLVFSSDWFFQTYSNPKWWPFYKFRLEHALKVKSAHSSIMYLDQAIYDITRSMEFKFRPFVHEMIKQILLIATGQHPGFRPARDNEGFPLDAISDVLKRSSRELLSYPIFMQGSMMTPEDRHQFIYNSITYNTATHYQQKLNPNIYLNEIMNHLKDYLLYFIDHLVTRGTSYADLHKYLEIIPCSTRGSVVHDIKKCVDIYDLDPSFWYSRDVLKYNARYGAPINAQFCKGFLGFRWKEEA